MRGGMVKFMTCRRIPIALQRWLGREVLKARMNVTAPREWAAGHTIIPTGHKHG